MTAPDPDSTDASAAEHASRADAASTDAPAAPRASRTADPRAADPRADAHRAADERGVDEHSAIAGASSPIDVATRAFDAGLVVEPTSRAALSALDLAAGAGRLVVAEVVTWLERLPLDDGALGDGCAERRVRGVRDSDDAAARIAERARAMREAAVLKRELERLDG